MLAFDSSDVDYLVSHFGIRELRREVHHAGVEAAVCRTFDDPAEGYWLEFASACRLALDILKSQQPKPRPVPGKVNIEAIKDSTDIVSLVERYTTLRKSGNRLTGLCPFHDDKHPSFFVYPEQQRFYCFGCGKGGDIFEFVKAIEGCDFKEALGVLNGSR